jgi:hypothetical protein
MRTFLLLLIFTLFTTFTTIDQERPRAEINAAMVYNFVKYVNWPTDQSETFTIAVYGDDNETFKFLSSWYHDKPKGDKKMKIIKIEDLKNVSSVQVLFISKNKNKEFEQIFSQIQNKPILSITESSNLGQKGSCINMKIVDGKLKFEINQKSFNDSNLKVSGQLTSMATVI